MKHLVDLKQISILLLLGLFVACSGDSNETANSTQSTPAPAVETEEELVARARGIHDRVITLDTHADINTSNFTATNNYTQDLDTQVNLPKMETGGLDVAWFIVYTGQGPLDEEGYAAAYANAIDKFDAIHRLAEEIAPDKIELAYTSADVRRIAASGKKVAMIGIENAYPIGTDMSRIEEFYDRGGRYMSLAHNGHSQFSDSQTGEATNDYLHGGLSQMGRQAIAEMNRLGIMIDVSHPSKDSIMQSIELSRAPVIASHSSARALTDHTRNLDDEMLYAIRDNNGVAQATAFHTYVNEARRSFLAEGNDNVLAPVATVSDFIDHVDYMVELIGLDHVGISSDFDGGGGIEGWNDASETFNVTLELVRRGYTEEEIARLWSGNLLRVLDEVQRIAAEI
ncbi:MAG: dipeptidase [Pseudomonadota bacterium]|jgi:membrane dipeptidase|nr:dipeptidase [Pseudomonadales bacterium]MEE3289186.1 dipeptidase [Pseudomonadota bacterium]GIT21050.1 MAG: dipeptidase [Gammaproteobacteria bacterium]